MTTTAPRRGITLRGDKPALYGCNSCGSGAEAREEVLVMIAPTLPKRADLPNPTGYTLTIRTLADYRLLAEVELADGWAPALREFTE